MSRRRNPLAGLPAEDEPSACVAVEESNNNVDVIDLPRRASPQQRGQRLHGGNGGSKKGALVRCQELIENCAAAVAAAQSISSITGSRAALLAKLRRGGQNLTDDHLFPHLREHRDAAKLRALVLDDVVDATEFFIPSSASDGADGEATGGSVVEGINDEEEEEEEDDDDDALFDLSAVSAAGSGTTHAAAMQTSLLHIAVRHGSARPDLVEELVALGLSEHLAWERDGEGSIPLQLSLFWCPHMTPLLLTSSQAPSVSAARQFLHDVLRAKAALCSAAEDGTEDREISAFFRTLAASLDTAMLVKKLLHEHGGSKLLDPDGAGVMALEVLADNSASFSKGEIDELLALIREQDGKVPDNSENKRISSGLSFSHPCMRVLVVLLLIANHFAVLLFAVDFYNRSTSVALSKGNHSVANVPTVNFVFRVVDLLSAAPWPEAEAEPGLFSARLLCIFFGALIGILFCLYVVHPVFLRWILRLRMFGADEPLDAAAGEAAEEEEGCTTTSSSGSSSIKAPGPRGRRSKHKSTSIRVAFSNCCGYQPFSDHTEIDRRSSSSSSRFTRRSLSHCAFATSPTLKTFFRRKFLADRSDAMATEGDISGGNEEERAERASAIGKKIRDKLSGEEAVKNFIASRGRFSLVALGLWTGLYCASLAFEAIEGELAPSSSSIFHNTTVAARTTFSTAATHFFYVSLYLSVLLFFVVAELAVQRMAAPTAWLQAQYGAFVAGCGRGASQRVARSLNRARTVASPILHFIFVGGLVVCHYFSAAEGVEIPLFYEPATDSSAAEQSAMLGALTCLSAFSVLLVVAVLHTETATNPNMQVVEVLPAGDGTVEEVRHALFLPAFSVVRGNPSAWLLALVVLELTVDVMKLSVYLDACIGFLEGKYESSVEAGFIVAFVVALVLLLAAVLLFFFGVLLRCSTWFSTVAPTGVLTAPASRAFLPPVPVSLIRRQHQYHRHHHHHHRAPSPNTNRATALVPPSPSTPGADVSPVSPAHGPAADAQAHQKRGDDQHVPVHLQPNADVLDRLDLLLQEQRSFFSRLNESPPPPPAEQERSRPVVATEDTGTQSPPPPLPAAEPEEGWRLDPTEEMARSNEEDQQQQQQQQRSDAGQQQGHHLRFNLPATEARLKEGKGVVTDPQEIRMRRLLLLAARQGVNVWSAALCNQSVELRNALCVAPQLVHAHGGPGLRINVSDEPVTVWQHRQCQINSSSDGLMISPPRLTQRLAYYDVALLLDDFPESQQQQQQQQQEANGTAEMQELRTVSETPATLLQHFGATLLHYAVFANAPAAAAVLMDFGADCFDARTRSGNLSALDLCRALGRNKLREQILTWARRKPTFTEADD